MAIIVQHKQSHNNYILLGTGFGIYKSSRPSFLFKNLFPVEEQKDFDLVAVSDRNGNIKWFYSEELVVVEVDGERPSQLL